MAVRGQNCRAAVTYNTMKKAEKYFLHRWHSIRLGRRRAGVPQSVPSEWHPMVRLPPDRALRSLKRNQAVIALMMLSMGLSVGLAMTAWTIDRQIEHLPTIE